MTNSNRPKWLDVAKLKKVAGKEAEQRSELHVNLPVHSHKVITAYICPQCRLQFTSSDVEIQVKKAARTGTQYIECPKCGGVLREGRTAVVRDITSIVNRADRYEDSNKAPSRSIDTWIDKAIYGRIVQKLGEHIQQYGIDNPQLKFQRGIRAQKFPGQPMTAKGAEFTVEFVDFNNTRNRIVVQAGLTIEGELIYPRTFKTLSGSEYPLTKQAIDDFTSGKLYDRVMSDATIRPLNYRYPDPTRFREISADNQKMQKKAQGMDPATMDANIQGMGVTDPTDIQAMKDVLMKYQATPVGSTPIGAPPVATPNTGGAFMNGVGLSSKLNMKKADVMSPYPGNPPEDTVGMRPSDVDNTREQVGIEALYAAVMDGLAFPEAYEAVRTATQGNALITQAEFDQMGQLITGDDQQGIIANKAAELIKLAEIDTIKHLHKTAETVRDEFAFDDMSSSETDQWIKTYVDTYNKALDNGEGIIAASHKAHKIAADIISESRIKHALRDKDTLVPQVDVDPDWSIATTGEFEAEFGGKYEDTDGGILPVEDRGYTTMFKGTASEINRRTTYADVKQKGDKWVVTPKGSEKVLGEHGTKEEATKQLQAIEISKHKQSSVEKKASPDEGISPAIHDVVVDAVKSGATFEETAQKVKSETGLELRHEDWEEAQTKTASIEKKAAYEITMEGQNALTQLAGGQQIAGPNSGVLHTVLQWVYNNPIASLDEMAASYGGADTNMLRQAVQHALTMGYVDISPEVAPESIPGQEGPPGALANTNKIEKTAEPTGFDLDADEVGQNPINYSRLKGQVQDLLRAGNIPPSKVDMHKLKDGGYSLDELRNLIDTFKVNTDTYFPTAHAKVDPEQMQKKAEEKLSDLFKQMPMKKEVIAPPDKGESSAEGKADGGGEPPFPKEDMKEEATETDRLEGGLADNISSTEFDPEELVKGIEVEKEHTVDKELAEEIAKDHLIEIPDYYTRLKKMEEEAKAELSNNEEVTNTDSLFAALKATARQDRKVMGINPEGMENVCAYCQSVYDDITGEPIRRLTPEEYATVQSHGICGPCGVDQIRKAKEYKAQQQASKLDLTKKAIEWPWSKPDAPEEQEGEVVEPTTRIEPPQFQTRRSPGITGEPAEATPEQAELIQGLAASKTRITQLQTEVKQIQDELKQKIAPIQARIGAEGQNQLRATKQLVAMMTELSQELVQADNQIGHYSEQVVSKKLTPSEKVKILLERFGAKAEQAIAEAQKNLNEIEQVVVGKYRQWPAKISAVEGVDEQYLATLYQNAFNTIAGLLDDVQELNFALAA